MWQNIYMKLTQKELAFLSDLSLASDWTERFTNIFDENIKVTKKESVLYLNAGTGNHTLAIREKLKKGEQIFAVSENKHLQKIAQAKADLIKADITFSTEIPNQKFDTVIADATFVKPEQLPKLVNQIAESSNKNVAFYLVTAHSFGEVFSFLWETLFNLGLSEKGAEVERLIAELPTVGEIEQMAESVGLQEVTTVTKNEFFDYKNGTEFINSPMVENFLLPKWLDFLTNSERRKVIKTLVKVIDTDDQQISFMFSVKATLVIGKK